MLKNFFEINDLISEKLQSNEPFSLLRLDNSAGYILQNLFNNTSISSQFFNNTALSFEGGITPGTTDYYIDTIVPMVTQSMKECDILGFVDMSLSIQNDASFTKTFGEKPMFFGHDSLMVLDPIGVLRGGICGTFKVESPWTKYLKNKKVLIISTHCETIKSQWQQIDKIWGDNLDLVAPFDLVGCIRTPYHPLIDDRQLISGASTSSPIYAEHAKKRGKVGIQTGGVHQLFFGILGHRWSPEANNGYRVWAEYYNEHWTYPFKEDEARNRNQVRHLEGNYAYWKP